MEHQLVEKILFVVSPQNPFKRNKELLDAEKRIELVEKALARETQMEACSIELSMPKPSYTIDTLKELKRRYPSQSFALIMGGDNLENFHLWREHQAIYENYPIFVYPRSGETVRNSNYPNIRPIDAPLFPVSSTDIREKIKKGEDISPFVPAEICNLIRNYYTV